MWRSREYQKGDRGGVQFCDGAVLWCAALGSGGGPRNVVPVRTAVHLVDLSTEYGYIVRSTRFVVSSTSSVVGIG